MRERAVNQRDMAAGIVFMAFGVFGLVLSRELEVGSIERMGPGYFPNLISILLLVVGIVVGVQSLWSRRSKIAWGTPRPLITVVGGVLAFGGLTELAGFAVASLVLLGLVYLSAWKFRFLEFVILYLIIFGGSYLIFVKILSMPLRLFGGF